MVKEYVEYFAKLVEQDGAEISAAMIVGGQLVSGMMVRAAKYDEWSSRSIRKALGLEFTAERADELLLQETKAAALASERTEFPAIFIRDAIVVTAAGPITIPFLMVSTAAISAFTLAAASVR